MTRLAATAVRSYCWVVAFIAAPLWSQTPPAVQPAAPQGPAYSPELVAQLLADVKATGDARRGALVFRGAQFACLSCHKVGASGGSVGPDLSRVALCLKPDQIVESVLWPKRSVKDEFKAWSIGTASGERLQGYKVREDDKELVLRDPATGKTRTIARDDIEDRREVGTLMPDGLTSAMSREQLRDLLCFLTELGRTKDLVDLVQPHVAAAFPLERAPLYPEHWPSWQHSVNSERLYDFYARQADFFAKQPSVPMLLTEYPGLDGPKFGHWGKQNEKSWADDRWNNAELGSVMCGVFHGQDVTVPRGICVRLGDRGEMSVCFNPETLQYEALWQGGFVKFSAVRHGFMHGLRMDGTPLPRPPGKKPDVPFVFRGMHRHGARVLFAYSVDGVEMLDVPWIENGQFTRLVAPADRHPLAKWTRGGPAQWPQTLTTRGSLGSGGPYVIDTVQPPFDNPWKAPLFFGGHDFLPDGAALVCTMQGDVWHVSGLDDKLDKVRWRRFASGLHQALGVKIVGEEIYVLGRDQITRLHDRNGDGEADFYECFSNAYAISTGGHDYVCGLERDVAGNFYTASSKQGLIRIRPDGKKVDVLATGFRNPDGLGLYPDGAVTVPCSEGDWTPASMICLVKPDAVSAKSQQAIGGHHPPYFGYGGPRDGRAPDLPLVYLPRGLDNSSGGQVFVDSNRWGPLKGRMIHLSFGACSHFLLLRDEVDGFAQGAVVPLPGEFLSGVHRGRFHPRDGQLYVSGMAGWGAYSLTDGCFQRVRYTGKPVQLPTACRVHRNGVHVTFTEPIDAELARDVKRQFAQCWNYRYSVAYGSPEFSPRHPGTPGHDPLAISRVHVLEGGRSIFLEMPELQPVNQLHLRLRVHAGPSQDLFLTVHALAEPYTSLPGYQPRERTIAAHPILADLAAAKKTPPNPWRTPLAGAQPLGIQADKNLTFKQRSLTVRAGQALKLTFTNPDTVPHNWVLGKPDSLPRLGDLANRLIADPEAVYRQYVPKSPDVLAYTDIVPAQASAAIYFHAPMEKGRYPYLCTFPGHWMVMNGVLIVE